MPAKKTIKRKIGRKASDGTFVDVDYANAHPNTTIVETIKIPLKKKKTKK